MPVVITGEHKGDYVQFTYGTFSWASNDETRCSQGGWDPRGSGDTCGIFGDKSRRIRRIDCTFPC
ncbi:hypothetical protein C7974DRAFT_397029 [Boeremia exigua]|uniref:uncharacterized protein n=1 Tax=Boeremia exigua TaxID=749465 RepID=UPI001E8DA8E2|nr:uncharacterized protein C7974DRAFT_397029 [Boeremia exigua]KAH6621722.1 hypothetical protein C7974DRAFT_397029 [Boeremia exigua]